MKMKMQLIGLLLNLAAITVTVTASHHEALKLSPSEHPLVRYTNESLIVQCLSSSSDGKLQWKSPKGEIITEHKGRIHIEQSASDHLKLVFTHIALADKGNWTCESVSEDEGGSVQHRKSFEFIVYEKITFTEKTTIITVKEGKIATILCEVKGEPQPNITWYFNGQPIDTSNSSKYRGLADGLTIHKVTQNDTGEYTCRAYQVSPIASDMQERTILMKIEHKPFWTHKHHISVQYVYINGSVNISCEAIGEPPANFTWLRGKKHLHNDKYYTIETDPYMATLTVHAIDKSIFDEYKCRASNHLGAIERVTSLEQGEKPPPPSVFQLRGFNSHTFDVDLSSVRTPKVRQLMDVIGFRIEYMSELDFKRDAGKWTNTRRRDFPFQDGATFLINQLEPNTTYFMRAASRNLAGLSDWTKVEKFRTLSNEPPQAGVSGLKFIGAVPLMALLWMISVCWW